ncbi:predicted protein [Histoplasma capsulatum H143]|uniref:Uncharacterized protein n=1 Tax=Ajellomyces capsulatus (strain H143) TaxID=544712 RepID=C6HQX1_AJECH|nr:predicted protein [Histoplasma capsulatum H143]
MSNPGYTPNEPRNELDHRPGPVMAKQGDPQIVNLLPTLFTFPLRSAFILVLTGATSLMDIRLRRILETGDIQAPDAFSPLWPCHLTGQLSLGVGALKWRQMFQGLRCWRLLGVPFPNLAELFRKAFVNLGLNLQQFSALRPELLQVPRFVLG